jgi:hypothetical protein
MGRELAISFPAMVTFHPATGGDHISVIGKAAPKIIPAMTR